MGKYVLFGSAPMGIRDLKKCNDIDILVTEDLFKKLQTDSKWKFKIASKGSEALEIDNIEIFKDWPDVANPQKLIDSAEIIDDLPFVNLYEVLKWKKFRSKEKDLVDIKLIEDFLKK